MASFAISFKSVHAVIVSCAKAKKNTKLLTRVKTELLQKLYISIQIGNKGWGWLVSFPDPLAIESEAESLSK